MQHTVLRSEVFILNPKEVTPANYKGMGESLAGQSLAKAVKSEQEKLAEIKLGLKPLAKEEKEDPVNQLIDQLYENDVS
jgi:hypothetical protein